jgi:hypothetical protein
MPLFGPPDVFKMRARIDVRGLIKALSYGTKTENQSEKYASLRGNAAAFLGEFKTLIAKDALIQVLLNDKISGVRAGAANALRKIWEFHQANWDQTELVRDLNLIITAFFSDKEYFVRRAIARLLASFNETQAVQALESGLQDQDIILRNICAEELFKKGRDLSNISLMEKAESTLVRNLLSGILSVQTAELIGELQIVNAIPALTKMLSVKDVSEAAKKALEKIRTPEAKASLEGFEAKRRLETEQRLEEERRRSHPETLGDFATLLCELIDLEKPNNYPSQQSINTAQYYGQILNRSGGFELMQKVMQIVIQRRPFGYERLNYWWDGIGEWRY